MKIILSRKGFDMGCGGSPSPLIIDENRLFSLPIPCDCETYYSYRDLQFSDGISCYDIMEQLGIGFRNLFAHTDPDIRKNIFASDRIDPNWRPMFGQVSIPQSHLNKHKVGDGDIFLYYGLFQIAKKDNNGNYCFVPGTKQQIIWGYMQIDGNPHAVSCDDESFRHPHFYCRDDYCRYANTTKQNTVYFGRNILNGSPNIPGFGAFRFDNRLVLSQNPGDRAEEYNRWKLPIHFCEHKMTGNKPNRFFQEGDYCVVQAANRGQEFVINDDRATEWALDLITSVPIDD